MKYFIYDNKDYIDKLNGRGFPLGNVTKQWVEVKKHPIEEKWAAIIPDDFISSLSRLLTEEETITVNENLFDELAEDWNE